jgi:cytochrome c-type biogenesis protein CcmH
MSALFAVLFGVIVLCAAVFAIWPVMRMDGRGRVLLAGALVLFVAGIGVGTYLVVGRPALGVRALEGPNTQDLGSLVTPLVQHLHKVPGDGRGWTMLGRLYLTVNDPEDAAKALARAVTIARASGKPSAELYSTYGEAVVRLSSGTVPPEAQAAFEQALLLDPKDSAARYFLGFAYAAHGENAKAIALWQSLLNDAPANAPYRQELVDRIAALTASSGARPDISAMVAGLAARLKANPNDAQGWQRLVQAYAVLGDKTKAVAALTDARAAMKKNARAMAALSAEAKDLKLEN